MKTISRAIIRGKPLDKDCKRAYLSKYEYGPNDNRCFCYGLYSEWSHYEIAEKCIDCKAFVDNADTPKAYKKAVSRKH